MEVEFATSGLLEEEAVEVDDNVENSNFEGERCGICMDLIIDRGVLDCCQHWFCFGCIDNWSTITNLCPLCQNEFQSITCVPVYDTIGSIKVDDESFTRDDDWSIEGQGNTFSFPSYYIDENAVICLDGDKCKIRSGLATVGEGSNLDTSIACDSCDIWYHAFCVGFDPEDTSEETWLCPRCTVDQVSQKSLGPSIESDPKTNDSFSAKLSVCVADAGETAIVVSMVGENESTRKPSESIHPSLEENLKTNALNPAHNNLKAETPSSNNSEFQIQPVLESHGLKLSLSCDTCNQPQPSDALSINEVKINCADEATNAPDSSDGVKDSLRKFQGSNARDKQSEESIHLGLSVGSSWSVDRMKNIKTEIEDQVSIDVQQQNLSVGSILGDEKTFDNDGKGAASIAGAKRRHLDCSDDGGEVKAKNEDADISKRLRADANCQINPIKGQDDAYLPDNSQKCSTRMALPKEVKLKQSSQKEDAKCDIMSIVKGTFRRSSKSPPLQKPANKSSKERENIAGLRVKKIMKRASEDEESSTVVEKLRKEIREAIRNKPSADIGENLFDPKLLAAFRAAVVGTTIETPKKLPPSAIKAKKSLLQKGKVRENLTKKIYADSNGKRRRAWDRECEVEFWKHRCSQASKPEKVATLKSVLDLLRRNPSTEGSVTDKASENQTKNPILARLYLADTSVFPRKDDIKPLSAITSISNSEQRCSMDKVQRTSTENCTHMGANKVSPKPGALSDHDKGSQNKLPNLKDKAASSKIHPDKSSSKKETSVQSDDKKLDKRKWAMEVLARKKAAGNSNASHEKQEDNAVLKGKFPLLAQLPIDMRPALAASRHNKIPILVRQAQLYRLTEHFLKKEDLPEIRRTGETELAVADAINIEKEIADRSNTKIVYLNLCSQEILRRSDVSKPALSMESNSSTSTAVPDDKPEKSSGELPSDPAVLDALRNAGLLSDSPPSSPCHKETIPVEVDDTVKQIDENGPDNVFEIDSHPEVDIYGDFEYDLEDEDFIGAAAIKASKLQSEESDSRMKVVFSTLKPEKSVDVLEIEDHERLVSFQDPEGSPSLRIHSDKEMMNSSVENGTEKSTVKPESLPNEEGEELSPAECEELYGPDKEPLINKLPEEESRKLYGLVNAEASAENKITGGKERHVPCQAENDIVTSHRQNSSGIENSPNYSQTSDKVSEKNRSNTESKKQCDNVNSVAKKVEAYIKEHIRPLCKSGIITSEQYRWAVAKTTDKVMKYHSNDKNASFLIKEGEKVKKLAQQYVEAAAQQKEKSDAQ